METISGKPSYKIYLGLAGLVLFNGCATQINNLPEEAAIEAPARWQSKPVEAESILDEEKAQSPSEPEPLVEDDVKNGWLASFNDDKLNNLAELALENNPDLLGSAAQLKSAIEQVTITGAALWPSLNANYQNNQNDTKIDGVSTKIRTINGVLEVSWELDIWGKLSQRKKSSKLSALAQSELYKAAELSLVGNVSRAWFNAITNKLQFELTTKQLESFKETSSIIEDSYQNGLRSALDVYLSRSDVQTQLSLVADSHFNYQQSLRALNSLVGEYPDNKLQLPLQLPELNGTVSAGLPAQLLTRRPDLKASQLQYKARIAEAKASHRDRYPRLIFNGSIRDSREHFNQLFENNNMLVTLLTGVTQPVFKAGALKAREQQALHHAEAAYANLVKTTLSAYEEVENALNRENALINQYKAIKLAVTYAKSGFELALDRYQSGIENYNTVLQSQRSLFNSMRNEINLRNALLQNRISAYLALGGDFSSIDGRDPLESLPEIPHKEKE